ncbi:ornithine cyclodeaminase [Demequina sp. NBRC 110051]|uniref:ornithine cyclodeaminase n=1 Tax=Demequina sp. NBRC 110051 TaxID=1570340 RepID=UPI000A066C77|nr:ornithine cyclodeaminase [Demequina sp. NBRC 110051]
MVMLVDVPRMSAWIAHTGTAHAIVGLRDRLEADYRRWPQFDKTPRIASHSPIGVIELMPIADADRYAFKYVNGHPENPVRGFQTVTAFGALADVHNGYPILIAEMTLLTALRTAATSAMASSHLARPDSTTMALIGNGSQSEFQALGMRAALGISRLRLWDTDPSAMDKVARNLEPWGFEIYRATSAEDACRGADIITTCTADKALATIVRDEWVAPGTHLNAIGGDCPGKTELDPAILTRGDVFVEFTPQTRIEGEIQQLDPDHPVTELWTVIDGTVPGRTSAEQVTVFDSVGFALEDFSALAYLADAVAGTAFAGEVDLVAEPHDPRDLFSLVAAATADHAARVSRGSQAA